MQPVPGTLKARSRLLKGYRPISGMSDELIGPDGTVRPQWAALIAFLSGKTADGVEEAFARGHQYMADSGVFFRHYGSATSGRDWPLSPVPVILAESEWREIETGLVQRADLLESVVADIYGENRLAADGHLPAQLIATNPNWLRPMVGVKPRSGHFLHFVAFEIGRGPDGRWWVLSDLTDAPSGAGFALENRIASTRIFTDLYRKANVHRLAGFFRDFRTALERLSLDGSGRPAILTPGPMADTYDEHAYIARYLGLPLLEGEDLLVENGCLRLRTVDGLVPIDVLWRRMDSKWSDPIELEEASQIGTPGLLSALRQGQVSMVNALGVGILETQALMAFLPKISEVLTGQPLSIPNVATWWCGQEQQLSFTRDNADRMMIGPALASRMPFEDDGEHAIGGQLFGATGLSLDEWLVTNADRLVARELATLSSTPVYRDGALEPRPMSLRVFLARTQTGWQVMPGGFARIGATTEPSAISLRRGGSVADVWIIGDAPIVPTTLLAQPQQPFVRGTPGLLPSQAADNLFWVGRYVERTEALLRLVRAYNVRVDETPSESLLKPIGDLLGRYGVDASEPFPEGVLQTLSSAIFSASQIRDRFNVDAWAALMDMDKSMKRIARRTEAGGDAASVASVMLRKIAGFSGLIHENMYRTSAWQFLTLGRSVERAVNTLDLVAAVLDPASPEGALELAIEVGDSIIVHRQRYALSTSRGSVIDLLVLDGTNPRAVMFHLSTITDRVRDLSQLHSDGRTDALLTLSMSLQSQLATVPVDSLDLADLARARSGILDFSVALNAIFMH